MIDNLKPLTFDHLMRWILREQKKSGSIFGVRDFYQANPFKTLPIGDDNIETPFGPAAGPHTQYAQSIIAAYAAGYDFGQHPNANWKTILELHDIPSMQNESARKGWPSSETATGELYPTYGASENGISTPDPQP